VRSRRRFGLTRRVLGELEGFHGAPNYTCADVSLPRRGVCTLCRGRLVSNELPYGYGLTTVPFFDEPGAYQVLFTHVSPVP